MATGYVNDSGLFFTRQENSSPGAETEERHPFGVSAWFHRAGSSFDVQEQDIAAWPFCALRAFRGERQPQAKILIVAPLSGHYAFITREMMEADRVTEY